MADGSIVTYADGHIFAELTADGGEFELRWDDGVANEFTETYDRLSLALLRLGVLVRLAEGDFAAMFAQDDAAEFTLFAEVFLTSTMTD